MMKKSNVKQLVYGAVTAALYAALTLAFSWISYGTVQFRVAEVLTALPAVAPFAVPGLTVGCIVANMVGGYGLLPCFLPWYAMLCLSAACSILLFRIHRCCF